MPDNPGAENAPHDKSRRTAPALTQVANPENMYEQIASVPPASMQLLGDPRLNSRGNKPVKNAVMRNMQQNYGNHATQRYLQRVAAVSQNSQDTAAPGGQAVQRKGTGSTAGGQPSTTFTSKSTSYTISGTSLKDAFDVMSGREEAGDTSWKPAYNLTKDDNGNVTGVTITVEITVLMPSWPNSSKLGKDAKAEWDRFYKALDKHEQGHVDIAKAKFRSVAQKMIGKSETDAAQEFQTAVEELQKETDAYDAKTDHGINEGTVLDLSKDPPPPQTPAPAP